MLKNRLLAAVGALGLLLLFALLVGALLPRLDFFSSKRTALNTNVVIQQIQTLSQLVTVKYVMEKAIVFEDAKWYGESRVIMVAHGIVKAGVDLKQLTPDDLIINEQKKSIVINLPPGIITDAYLDDKQTQVLERSTGLLRTFDKNLEQDARKTAVDDIKRAARSNGILKDAEDRARLQLSNLFLQLGFTEVEIRSK
jgi:hypothetical protein